MGRPRRRQALSRQRHDGGRFFRLQGNLPTLRRLNRIAWAEHIHVRHRPQAGKMFHRLVRRAVFTKANQIVSHHVDDALFRKADSRMDGRQ